MHTLHIGTRRSALALTQTEWVVRELQSRFPQLSLATKKMVTKGDRVVNVTLAKVGGKGLFVKEIEQALLDREIDVAVHSMKDVPGEMAGGLMLAAVCKREDPRDCLISRDGRTLDQLPEGAVVGTSSLRRQAQLQSYRPDLKIEPVRGNIDTRLRKLREGQFDAIVLAAAGLHRMRWHDVITEYLDPQISLPAVGQGAVGLQCREDDGCTREVLQSLDDGATARAVAAERAFLHCLNGSCQIPIAGYATLRDDGDIELTGMVATPNGANMLRQSLRGENPQEVGEHLAGQFIRMGADKILDSLRKEA